MHNRRETAARRDRKRQGQEGSLINTSFIGSYPSADFVVQPSLPEIAFLGRSNVGKSTLINALTGRRALARTSGTPGKTRMCTVYDVDGRYYLVDLPGYGYAKAPKSVRRELSGLLTRYLSERAQLAAVVWLLDIRRDPSTEDLDMGALIASRAIPTLVALTKGDKFGRGQRAGRTQAILEAVHIPGDQCVVTSAKTKDGIQDLRDSIHAFLSQPD
jgi:GTP-binding protein